MITRDTWGAIWSSTDVCADIIKRISGLVAHIRVIHQTLQLRLHESNLKSTVNPCHMS